MRTTGLCLLRRFRRFSIPKIICLKITLQCLFYVKTAVPKTTWITTFHVQSDSDLGFSVEVSLVGITSASKTRIVTKLSPSCKSIGYSFTTLYSASYHVAQSSCYLIIQCIYTLSPSLHHPLISFNYNTNLK
jgi:hypothetical protein